MAENPSAQKFKNFMHILKIVSNCLIAIFIIITLVYARVFFEKTVIKLPADAKSYYDLTWYVVILSLSLVINLVIELQKTERTLEKKHQKNLEKNSNKEENFVGKLVKLFYILLGYLFYPFIIFYFICIDVIPNFYGVMHRLAQQLFTRASVRTLDVVSYWIPSLIILLIFGTEVIYMKELHYFSYSLNLIFVPLIWNIYQIITRFAIKSLLDGLVEAEAISLPYDNFDHMSLRNLKKLTTKDCLVFTKTEPADGLKDRTKYEEFLIFRYLYATSLMESFLILEILKRQGREDIFFAPFSAIIRYGYLTIWIIIVLMYILKF